MLLAPAKINLHLAVGEREVDGYHQISSLFCKVGLCDEIHLAVERADLPSVRVTGLEGICQTGEDTMSKAVLFWMKESCISLSVGIACRKHIPQQAGLGGGSSDAAVVLRELETIFPLGWQRLEAVAERVGCDVPFFLSGAECAWVTGRGEQIETVMPHHLFVCLVMPRGFSSSTRDAYHALDSLERPLPVAKDEVLAAFQKGSYGYGDVFRNDFLLVLGVNPFYKKIGALCKGLKGYGGLSGSGACWFFVSEDKGELLRFRKLVQEAMPDMQDNWMSEIG